MGNRTLIPCCFLVVLLLEGCKPGPALPKLPKNFPMLQPGSPPAVWGELGRGRLDVWPDFDPDSADPFSVDLRHFDLSGLDLMDTLDDLMYASFDTGTIWPNVGKMPPGYDWQEILKLGKNPGLGIRKLHQQGITGTGVGIAIIDQPLLTEHQEYVDQLRLYEVAEGTSTSWTDMASMHGSAVASIAVGKTVGVAPDADLYFIGTSMCNSTGTYEGNDYGCLAQSVRRILEINRELPEGRKIRVISISVGWRPTAVGYAEISAATQEAKEAGILVVSSNLQEVHGFDFMGLGRAPDADPDRFESYEPGLFWADPFYANLEGYSEVLMVPMDSRTTAGPGGVDEYVFYREGGWSWSIPYIAGVYALAAQVEPSITPNMFWQLALETGKTIEFQHEGEIYTLGTILDPVELMDRLDR